MTVPQVICLFMLVFLVVMSPPGLWALERIERLWSGVFWFNLRCYHSPMNRYYLDDFDENGNAVWRDLEEEKRKRVRPDAD
jgi:hypothetical protein